MAASRLNLLPIPNSSLARKLTTLAARYPELSLYEKGLKCFAAMGKPVPRGWFSRLGLPSRVEMSRPLPVVGRHAFFQLRPGPGHNGASSVNPPVWGARDVPVARFTRAVLHCGGRTRVLIESHAHGPGVLFVDGSKVLSQDRFSFSEEGLARKSILLGAGDHPVALLALEDADHSAPWFRVVSSGTCRFEPSPPKKTPAPFGAAPGGPLKGLSLLTRALHALSAGQYFHARHGLRLYGSAKPLSHCFELYAISRDPSLTPLARRALLTKILGTTPSLECKTLFQARHLFERGRSARALEHLSSLNTFEALLLKGAAHRRLKHYSLARAALNEAIKGSPADARAYYGAALLYREMEQVQPEYMLLRNAWLLRQDSLLLPRLLIRMGKYAEADLYLTAMDKYMPFSPLRLWERIAVARGLNLEDREMSLLSQLRKGGFPGGIAPGVVDLLVARKGKSQATGWLESYLVRHPGDIEAMNIYLFLRVSAPEPRESIDTLRKEKGSGFSSRDHSAVFLLNETSIRLSSLGTGYKRIHRVLRILNEKGADELGEIELPEDAKLLVLRSIKPDGSVFYPLITPQKATHTMRNLATGDLLELEYLLPLSGIRPLGAWYGDPHYFAHGAFPTVKSRLIVTTPDAMKVEAITTGSVPSSTLKNQKGMITRTYTLWYLDPAQEELRAFNPRRYRKSVRIGVNLTPANLAKVLRELPPWYGHHSLEMDLLIDSSCKNRRDRSCVYRLARWVQENISQDASGSSPWRTFHSRRGDRTILLRDLLHHAAIDSTLLYARPARMGKPNLRLPSPTHLALPLLRYGTTVFDLRSAFLAPGQMAPAFAGAMALEPRSLKWIRLPALGPQRQEIHATLRFNGEGQGTFHITDETTGFLSARRLGTITSRSRAHIERVFTRYLMHRFYPGAQLLYLTYKKSSPLRLEYRFTAPSITTPSGNRQLEIKTIPFPWGLVRKFAIYKNRSQDFLPHFLPPTTTILTIIPPRGWKVASEASLQVNSRFGSLSRSMKVIPDGRGVLTIKKVIAYHAVKASEWPAFREFIKTFSDYETLSPTMVR
ncbi:hypothetical protein KKF84_14355 [Myxococcota bacterium]|nr:hypothetical protein [Myxococcota bacterium]MBU1536504.1 hypothetical protein [Myxococcota bacterium]